MPSPYKFSVNQPSDAADRDDHEQDAHHAISSSEPSSPVDRGKTDRHRLKLVPFVDPTDAL